MDKFDLYKTTQEDYRNKAEEKLREILGKEVDDSWIREIVQWYVTLPYLDYTQPIREDNLLVASIVPYLLSIQYKKEGTYGRSWCKRGEMDTFFNLARKFDRLENMMLNGAKDEVGEGKIDTVGDLSNYGMLWMSYFVRTNFEEFVKWTANNC